MAELYIDSGKCTGCGVCLKSCAVSALSLTDKKKAAADGSCVMCGICVNNCPFGAISLRKEEERAADLGRFKHIWILAEQDGKALAPVAFELAGKGRELADVRGCELVAVLCGKGSTSDAEMLIASGAEKVILCDSGRLEDRREETCVEFICSLIEKYRPETVLCGATKFGRSIAPRIAARVRTGLTADCTELAIDPDTKLLCQTRPAFGGNLMATIICPGSRPQMATVRPGVMPRPLPDTGRSGEIIREDIPGRIIGKVELLEKIKTAGVESIAGAEKIIIVGRGIGNQKNLELAKEFAKRIGAELGCSRPLVDMGWCEYRHQVGQTGCSVAPKLLISVGVSGAVQHLAGIARAEKIIAINHDPEAAIFDVAHYAVVGDAVEILKELTPIL